MATIENINFTRSILNDRTALSAPGVWTHDNNVNSNNKYEYSGGKSIMALDIDWNGATWSSITASTPTTINSTADVLKAIKYASTQGGSGGTSFAYCFTINNIQYGTPGDTEINFYAPTSAGQNSYLLQSQGSGAPTWSSIKDILGYQQSGNGATYILTTNTDGDFSWKKIGIQYNGSSDTYMMNPTDGIIRLPAPTSIGGTQYEIQINGTSYGSSNGQSLGSVWAPTYMCQESGYIIQSVNGKAEWKPNLISSMIGDTAIGSTTKPVYYNGNGFIETAYTLGKSVPTNAIFTDTWRQINVNGSPTVMTNGTGTGAVNFKSGTKITVAKSDNDITFTHTNSGVTEKTTEGLYKIKFDAQGHITGAVEVQVSDLRALLDDIYEPKQVVVSSISVTPTSKTLSAYNGTQTFTAAASGGATASSTTWSITEGASYATLSASTGASVTITGNNTQSIPIGSGSASLPSTSPTIASNGSTTIACTASAVSTTATTQTVKLAFNNTTATQFSPTNKTVSITVPGQTATSAVKSYAWSITSGSSYASLTNATSATVTVNGTNSTSSNQTVSLKCIVTWNNNATKELTISVTVQAPVTNYYWYAGTTAVDGNNYTSVASQVQTIPSSSESILNNEYLYIVAPKTKTITVLDANTNAVVNMKTYNQDTGTFTNAETFVGDYKIYKSAQDGLGRFIINVN